MYSHDSTGTVDIFAFLKFENIVDTIINHIKLDALLQI